MPCPATSTGANIAMVVMVLTMIAMVTAPTARRRTSRRSAGSLVARARASDSATTMALSTTMPDASRKPISASRLSSEPATAMAITAISSDSGRAAHTSSASRQRPRKATRKTSENSAHHTALARISCATASNSACGSKTTCTLSPCAAQARSSTRPTARAAR